MFHAPAMECREFFLGVIAHLYSRRPDGPLISWCYLSHQPGVTLLKSSNRLVLILGVVLAIAAFAGVIVLSNQRPTVVSTAPTTQPAVYAVVDMPLGTVITVEMLEVKQVEIATRVGDAYFETGVVVGKTIRTEVKKGAVITPSLFSTGNGGGAEVVALLDPGLRAIAVTIDQSTGVGTLINVGDRVDLLIGFTGDKVPQITVDTTTHLIIQVNGFNPTTTKLLLQNMQVIGAILPPPPATTAAGGASGASGASSVPATTLTGSSELVILAVTPQQAEVIKFAQIDGQISLVLRSPKDFRDADGLVVTPPVDQTTGIVLKTLIDEYGVLPPKLIEATGLPTAPAP
jgi:Flp pilus assembly protein CpaB